MRGLGRCDDVKALDDVIALRTRYRRYGTARTMLSLAIRPHAAMGDGKLARQTLFIKRQAVKRDGRRLFSPGGDETRWMSRENTRVAAIDNHRCETRTESRTGDVHEGAFTHSLIAALTTSVVLVRLLRGCATTADARSAPSIKKSPFLFRPPRVLSDIFRDCFPD